MYLLDTNACIGILNNTSASLVACLRAHAPSEIRLCAVTKAELLFGARHSGRPSDNLRLLARFFEPFVSLSFDDACAERYGSVRADLATEGRMIGPNDLLIASVALAHDLTLVTHNLREFSRVSGLKIEDWQEDRVRRQGR
jgi:tRNA(fMet)-specific endonuclease VapC